jgi:NADH-quinone oxidoreductase subunit G
VLPAAAFAESDGTFVSSEGRAQRFFRVFVPAGDIQESWRWLADPAWLSLDHVVKALAESLPVFARIVEAAPPATFRMDGARIPRSPHRSSGRTAILANISVHEPAPPVDPDSPLNFSMEGTPAQPPAALVPFFWSPGWNSIQAVNKFQEEIAGPLRDGPAGVRLIEPDGQPPAPFDAPPAFHRREGELLVVPLHHVFGSEELSAAAPAIAQLAPQTYVALNPEDAARAGDELTLFGLRLPVKAAPELPRGVAGVPANLASLPAWERLP